MNDLYNGDPYGVLRHSADGTKWKKHKYIDIIKGRYIYKDTYSNTSTKSKTKSSASNTSAKTKASSTAYKTKSSGASSAKSSSTKSINRLNRANAIVKSSSSSKSSGTTSKKSRGVLTTINNKIIDNIQDTKQGIADTVSSTASNVASAINESTDDHSTNSTKQERDATRSYVNDVKNKSMSLIMTKTEEYNDEYGGNSIPSRSLEGMEALYLLNQYAYNEADSEGSGQSNESMKGGCDDAYERSSQIDRLVSATPVSSTHYSRKEAGGAAYTTYTFMDSDGNTFDVDVTDKTRTAYRATMVASNLGDDAIRTRTLCEYDNEQIAALAIFDIYGMTR